MLRSRAPASVAGGTVFPQWFIKSAYTKIRLLPRVGRCSNPFAMLTLGGHRPDLSGRN
jgi:hypothetical protein